MKMFPLQAGYSRDARPGPLSIPWSIAEKAYGVYAARYGRSQSLERLAERGGFGTNEMDDLYPPWRGEVDEIVKLRSKVAELEAVLAKVRNLMAEYDAGDEQDNGMSGQEFMQRLWAIFDEGSETEKSEPPKPRAVKPSKKHGGGI